VTIVFLIAWLVSLLLLVVAEAANPPASAGHVSSDATIVSNAEVALTIVRKRFPAPAVVTLVDTIEPLPGADESAPRDRVWHVRVAVRRPARKGKARDYKVDAYVRAVDGWTQYIGH
jgi:hypothetical protein